MHNTYVHIYVSQTTRNPLFRFIEWFIRSGQEETLSLRHMQILNYTILVCFDVFSHSFYEKNMYPDYKDSYYFMTSDQIFYKVLSR